MESKDYERYRLGELYRYVLAEDVNNFNNKFERQNFREKIHTLRELQFGVYHREKGFDLRHELAIQNKTPDWSLLDICGKPSEIVDVITLHQRYEKEREIQSALKSTNVWSGWIAIPHDHIFRKLADKSGQYASLFKSVTVPYTIAAFAAFDTAIDDRDVNDILYNHHGGWFNAYSEVAGIILFREKIFENEYTYFSNPWSEHVSTICAKYSEE